MKIVDSIKSLFGGDSPQESGYFVYARCRRCGEALKTRIDLHNSMSMTEEGTYVVRKTLVGGNRLCFERLEVTLHFDAHKRLLDQEVVGGELITAAEYEAATT
jgi:hypothetical protein